MKILIIDDEPLARQRLRQMIEEARLADVIEEGANGAEALKLCQSFEPDILLLDIRMPGIDGIEAAQHIMKLDTPPAIIFTTAYDEYALRAFDANAVGYLLKPIREEHLKTALHNARRLNRAQLQGINASRETTQQRRNISARLGSELRLIDLADIYYFLAEHKYVTVRYTGGTVLIEDSLRSLEEEFAHRFLRIHRNALVALDSIRALEKDKSGGHRLKLHDIEDTLEISRRHLPAVRKMIKSL